MVHRAPGPSMALQRIVNMHAAAEDLSSDPERRASHAVPSRVNVKLLEEAVSPLDEHSASHHRELVAHVRHAGIG